MRAVSKSREVCSLLALFLVAVAGEAFSATPSAGERIQIPGLGPGAPASTRSAIFRDAVLQAIRTDLIRQGIPESMDMQPEDLKIQMAAPVPGEDMGLQVKRMEFDSIRHQTIFQLWNSKQPQFLPFQVTTRWEPREPRPAQADSKIGALAGWIRQDVSLRGTQRSVPAETSRGIASTRVRPPAFVRPGHPATLIILGHNFRITTSVVPLATGSKGQRIRVRDAASGRVFIADVIAEGLLQTSF